MKNKLAIVYCVHHKPWLMMSTLITTLIQDYQNYDIFFLYQEGDGTESKSTVFRDCFEEYYALINECGINKQLDTYDPRTIKVCQISGKNIRELHFQNDHALDSGAWYKFIKTGYWKDYEYVLFMGEGALLTGETVLNDTLNFVQKNNVHFITGSQEKRRFPKDLFLNGFASSKNSTKMTIFHDRMIEETFNIFCRDDDFKKVMEKWPSNFQVEQQHHVPDVWGCRGLWLKVVNLFYPNFARPGTSPVYRIKQFMSLFNKWFSLWLQIESMVNVFHCRNGDYTSSGSALTKTDEYIYANGKRKRLVDLVDYKTEGKVKFHKTDEVEWFGATCNHFVSREFLEKFSSKLVQHNIYDVLELPFSATALEIIWGLIPGWLGFDKWFFSGIHRVRKNFVTYRREDDPDGMVRYMNRYYKGMLNVRHDGSLIKVGKCINKFEGMKGHLNNLYF